MKYKTKFILEMYQNYLHSKVCDFTKYFSKKSGKKFKEFN